jgi:hypothetical protein
MPTEVLFFTPLIYTLTPHICIPHAYPRTQTNPTTTRRFEDRVLEKITETIQRSAGDEHAVIPL